MGIDIFSAGNSSLEALIQTTLDLEAQPRFAYEDKKEVYKAREKVLTDLDSKLSSLNSIAKRLTDSLTDYFASKNVASSDEDLFTATAESGALTGSHDISISRLASSDTRVSDQFTSSGTDLRSFFDTNGSQTFQLEIAHPTTSDPDNRVSISVDINASGDDNDDIMKEIAAAINNAMNTAVTAETIDADEKLTASVVHEENGVSRLIFKSGKTGYTNRMDMTDSANSLLTQLGINSASQSSGTSGGYITAVGTSASDSALNAQLQVDGLTFYRDSNTIDDILDDVTMTIKDVTQTTETMQVSVDTETVKDELQKLMDSYNQVVRYLKEKARVDPTTKTRGPLAGDSTYSFVRFNLRNIFTGKIDGIDSGNPEHLFEIGITAANDGTLSFTDEEKFENALASGSAKVSDLFNSDNGIATQVKSFLETFVKVGGVIDDSKEGIRERIKSLDNQIERFDARLARREIQLRKQFAKMQEASALLGGQSAAFSNLVARFGY